jgi:hypothetical protein
VERFAALFDGDAEKTARSVNEEVKDPTACAVLAIAFVRGPEGGDARPRTGTFLSFPKIKSGGIGCSPPRTGMAITLPIR